VTLVQANWVCDVGFFFLLNFLFFFVLGGLSGMFVAHIGFDVIFHDTFFVIGHFHVMLAGAALSSCFAAFYYYFGQLFGVRYSRFFGYLHYAFYTAGQFLTMAPMFWLGYAGMPRRVLDYPSTLAGWHGLVSGGHFLTLLSLLFFALMLLDSFVEGRPLVSSSQGVSRLTNRLAFFAYEQRRFYLVRAASLGLARGQTVSPYDYAGLRQFCLEAEQVSWVYTFVPDTRGGKK
jgi:heme/copper-type cytochrome/quinol oxidase subunit 1